MPRRTSARPAAARGPMRTPIRPLKTRAKAGGTAGSAKAKAVSKRPKSAAMSAKGSGKPNGRANGNGNGNGSKRVTARANGRGTATAIIDQPTLPRTPWTSDADAGIVASRGKYVYCIIEAAEALRFGPIGIGADPSEVYTVHYRNLAAVVSDAPLEVLDSTRENVFAHERVNETVMREHTVIPMSFGTIFKTREDIVELLRSAAEAFGDVLNKMQNKLEFGLKVLWDREQAIRELEQDDEDIGRLKLEISSQKGPTYFARMQYGRLVDAALQARSEGYVAEILNELRDVSVASRINKPIGEKVIMNAAFLISRDREAAFDARVKSIASRFDTLTFKYTGPWPPYNFVNIRLKLERA